MAVVCEGHPPVALCDHAALLFRLDMGSNTQPLSGNQACGDLFENCQIHTFIEGSSPFFCVCPGLPGDCSCFINSGTSFERKAAV